VPVTAGYFPAWGKRNHEQECFVINATSSRRGGGVGLMVPVLKDHGKRGARLCPTSCIGRTSE